MYIITEMRPTKMKEFLIIGNWKLHKTRAEASEFVKKLLPLIRPGQSRFGIAAPFTCIESVQQEAKGTELLVGAQNISEHESGAYTGEISTHMIKDVGATFSLIGHSERRLFYHENDEILKKKLKRALLDGIKPILCVGETLEQRESHQAIKVLEEQLSNALSDLDRDEMHSVSIAYEPVWAIGTGHAATPETAQETHKLLRDFLARKWGEEVCYHLKILYGGSVNPGNIRSLLEQPDIDGALIGGASLEAESFAEMVNYAREL